MKLFSMFSGLGGFEIGFKQVYGKDLEVVGYSEIDKYAISVYEKQFPGVHNYGDATKIVPEDIPDFDILTGGFPCFAKDTIILTEKGFIPIQDINIGDKVYTHKNRWKKVTKKFITKNKPTIIVKGQSILPTETTSEHPFLAMNRTMLPTKHKKYVGRHFSSPDWIKAENLKDHFVGRSVIPNGKIAGSTDFWWIVGRYMADGWLVNRLSRGDGQTCRVVICENKKKANILEKRIKKVFHCCRAEERTAVKFHITNKEFADFLKPALRGAYNKTIPVNWLFGMSKKQAKAFLDGYLTGDGSYNKKFNVQSVSTVSPFLAIGISMLYEKVYGIRSTIHLNKMPKFCYIEGRKVNQQDFYVVRFPSINRSAIIKDGWSWGLIKENNKTGKKKTVYNLEVEEDNSYLANGTFVHNCQAFSIAGKRLGFEETRGTLFFEIARIVRVKKPKYLLLENVKGLVSHNKGNTIETILEVICDLGYAFDFDILNSRNFGVPQNRERIFIFCVREDLLEKEQIIYGNSTEEEVTYPKPTKTIDKLKERLLCNPKIKMIPFNFPQDSGGTCQLSDIIESNVDQKYYLSEKMINYLLGRAAQTKDHHKPNIVEHCEVQEQ